MSESRISSRYAKSLFELAQEQKNLDRVHTDMQLFAATCRENSNLVSVLKSPVIHTDKKRVVLEGIFGKHFNALSIVFLQNLVRKKREGYLPMIAHDFIMLFKGFHNIEIAKITSATALSAPALQELKQKLEKQTGKTIELDCHVDASLIGGVKIQIGDLLFDDSISGHLNQLKLHMK